RYAAERIRHGARAAAGRDRGRDRGERAGAVRGGAMRGATAGRATVAAPPAGPETRRGARGATCRRTPLRWPELRAVEGRDGPSFPDFFVVPRAAGVSADGVMWG
ncbi:MAG: hypothetical protein ACXVR1_08135, partial [Solirubrobacteraceae bacterium]